MQWIGIYFSLRPGMKEAYQYRHQHVPEALQQTLRRSGIHNYTIWNLGEQLFACYQVEDPAKCEQVLSACPVYQQWRNEMEQIVYVSPENGQKEWPMELMFQLNEQ